MRLIDADELLTAFPVDDEPTLTKSCVRMTIKNMPTIEPEPQWTPCSERLPESDGVYLVYAPDYRGGSSSAKEWHNGVMFAKFKRGKWSVEVGYYNRPGCVRAWMPLPDPHQEGEE